MKEEYCIVLDYLARGYASSYSGEPVAQTMGKDRFTLLEIVPRPKVSLKLGQELYIGPEEREEVKFIKGRLSYDKLTQNARSELSRAIEKILEEREEDFVKFFNKAGPVSIRKHALELLPSIGKEHARHITEVREEKPFQSFEDMSQRVHLLPNPVKVLKERIIEELQGNTKYYLFTVPFKQKKKY